LTVTSTDSGEKGSNLRHIRIAPKQGRRRRANEEPECIAISSDEEGQEVDEGAGEEDRIVDEAAARNGENDKDRDGEDHWLEGLLGRNSCTDEQKVLCYSS